MPRSINVLQTESRLNRLRGRQQPDSKIEKKKKKLIIILIYWFYPIFAAVMMLQHRIQLEIRAVNTVACKYQLNKSSG
jgi:hypothetical protein